MLHIIKAEICILRDIRDMPSHKFSDKNHLSIVFELQNYYIINLFFTERNSILLIISKIRIKTIYHRFNLISLLIIFVNVKFCEYFLD